MKLNELLDLFYGGCCFDTYDTVYDAVVTWDWNKDAKIDDRYPYYFKMSRLLASKLDIAYISGDINPVIVIEYTKLIKDNMGLFREFANEYWDEEYIHEDDDDFIYEFIEQIHLILSGLGCERDYKVFYELLLKCN